MSAVNTKGAVIIGDSTVSKMRILDCPKNALSSQIKNFTLGTAFSHSLGQKQYKKLKIEFFRPFFQPAQVIQSFTT